MQEVNNSQFNFENCVKCSECKAWCPVLKANPVFIGPKQAGPDGERFRIINPEFYTDNLELCINCKRCEASCPSGVQITGLIQKARKHYPGKRHHPLRNALLSNTDLTGSLMTPFAPIANFFVKRSFVKNAMDGFLGIDKRRQFPRYSSDTFSAWYRRSERDRQRFFPRCVNYFHGCYVNYNNPQLGKDLVKVLNAIDVGVQDLKGQNCCGVPLIAAGNFEKATKKAEKNLTAISHCDGPIITTSTTCALAIRDEYSEVLGLDNGNARQRIQLATQYIYEVLPKCKKKWQFKPGFHARAAYHCPCHQEKLGWKYFTLELMKMIPGLEVIELDSNCCGIAGTYGFKKENYETSQKIGEPLFNQIREIAPDFVICECETCKWQIEMSTGVRVVNPISLIAEAML